MKKCENCRYQSFCSVTEGPEGTCQDWKEDHDDREKIPFYDPPSELPKNYVSDGDGWE